MQVIDSLSNNERLTRRSGSRHSSLVAQAWSQPSQPQTGLGSAGQQLSQRGTDYQRPGLRRPPTGSSHHHLWPIKLSRSQVLCHVSAQPPPMGITTIVRDDTNMDPSLDSNDGLYFYFVFINLFFFGPKGPIADTSLWRCRQIAMACCVLHPSVHKVFATKSGPFLSFFA